MCVRVVVGNSFLYNSKMDHLADELNTLFHYCEGLRRDMSDLQARVYILEEELASLDQRDPSRPDTQSHG